MHKRAQSVVLQFCIFFCLFVLRRHFRDVSPSPKPHELLMPCNSQPLTSNRSRKRPWQRRVHDHWLIFSQAKEKSRNLRIVFNHCIFKKKKSHTRLDSAARPLKSQDKKFLRAHTRFVVVQSWALGLTCQLRENSTQAHAQTCLNSPLISVRSCKAHDHRCVRA